MSLATDLDNADRLVKDLEFRLRTTVANLQVMEKEIGTLQALRNQLKANLKYLKKRNVVTLAKEYRNAKDDLSRAEFRISMISNDRDQLKEIVRQLNIELDKAKKEYVKILKGSQNNVIHGKFGSKKNG